MGVDQDPVLSAMVLLRPESGRVPEAGGATAETVAGYEPAPASTAAAREFFADAGFELGELVANGFAITGPASVFERTFGERVERLEEPPLTAFRTVRGTLELDLSRLPGDVAAHLEAVAFSRPPDFGPTTSP